MTFTAFPRLLPPLLVFSALSGCSRSDMYGNANFKDNVAQAYEDCSSSEIEFLAAKHNLQLAFDACGSNRFAEVDWAPDGRRLYFQLSHGGHILNAEDKTISGLPTADPGSRAVWVRDSVLVLPLEPTGAGEDGWQLAFYDVSARTLDTVALKVSDPRDLQPAGSGDDLLMTASSTDGQRQVWRYNRNDATLEPAFPFLSTVPERFDYAADAGLLGVSTGKDGQLLRLPDGELVAEFAGAKRVIPHHEGRYVALEVDGEPISLFYQRSWNEITPEAREREERRRKQWEEGLPHWVPREAVPPEIHIVDLTTLQRFRITAFYGDHFEWWRPQNYWVSLILWGIEGKQLHRNVAITDIRERLRMAAAGELPWGLEIVETSTPDAGTEASIGPKEEPTNATE